MKIETVESYAVDVPMREPFITSDADVFSVQSLIIRLITDTGLEGIGEARVGYATHFTHESIECMKLMVDKYFGPALIGANPLDMNAAMGRVNTAWEAGHTITKSGLEMALYDTMGKHFQMSLSDLLGGVHHKKIGMVGSVSCAEPKQMATQAASWAEKGHKVLKVKIGKGANIHLDIERVRQVREAVGTKIELRLDCNSAFRIDTALRFIRQVQKYDPCLIEDPIETWNLDGMKQLMQASDVPICVDNILFNPQDVFNALSKGVGHLIKLKLQRVGGLNSALKMIAIAEAAGIPVVVGRGSTLSVAAAAEHHLIAVSKNVIPWGENTGPQKQEEDVVKQQPKIVDGYVTLPTNVGLGVDLDMRRVKEYIIE